MSARLALGALALAAVAGCRVDSLEGADYAGPKNTCDLCPQGASCSNGTCVAEQTNYPLVLEATPPTSSRFGAGVTFSVTVDDKRGGARDLKLPDVARVVARLEAGTSLPLVLRLERVGAVPGMASASFEAKTLGKTTMPTTPPLSVPPGDYHAFVAPANDADLASLPPVQLRNDATREPLVFTFGSGSHELRVAYGGALRKVDVALLNEAGKPLVSADEARDVYVEDLTTGRLASTIAHTCTAPGADLDPEVTIVLAPELAGHQYALRVETAKKSCSAAESPVRSTLQYDLQALDVEGRGNRVTLTIPQLSTTLARGRVTAFGTPNTPIEGKVVLRSVKLDHTSADVAGLLTSTATGTISRDGSFAFVAIPGTYRADIIPESDVQLTSSKFAICVDCTVPSQDASAKPGTRVAEFRVGSDVRNPLAFEVPARVQTLASAGGFDGALFTLGTWEASSSTSGGAFTAAGSPLLTRAQTGDVRVVITKSTGASWNVAGKLDPGFYDLVIRTPEASGYPWIVLPRFEVVPRATYNVGPVKASAPVVITGTVLDPNGAPIPRAAVRARALVTLESQKSPSGAVLVGETRADENGHYRIVVPSAFAPLSKEKTPT